MNLAPTLRQAFYDSNGNPLSGGKLYSYQAGTTTPQATYTDSSGGTPNANPVVLDASGQANVWLDQNLSYKFVLQDANGVTQWTVDGIIGILIPNAVTTAALQDLAVTTAKLADGAVTAAKMGAGAIGRSSLAAGAISKSNVATKTSSYTMTDNDDVVIVDATSGAVTITLPAASGETGRIFTIMKKDSTTNQITVARTGTDLIEGDTSQTIANQYTSVDFISDGSNWYVK